MSSSWLRRFTFMLPSLALSACGGMDELDLDQADSLGLVRQGSLERQDALSNGSYTIHPGNSADWCLQVANNVNRDGSAVVLGRCTGAASQSWTVTGTQVKIFGNKCLNVKDGQDKNGTRLQIWTCDDGDANSRFTESNGRWTWSGHQRVLDVVDGKLVDGSAIQIWQPYNQNTHQQFQAKLVTQSQAGTTPVAPTQPVKKSSRTNAPAGLDVAPYFVTWAQWGQYLIKTPLDALNKAGADSLTIAFGIAGSGGGCNLSSDLTQINSQVKSFADKGKRVIFSFGGASGTYIQQSCSQPDKIAEAIATQMRVTGQHNLDFDIENASLNDRNINGRLIQALKILQNKYSDLYVSYTLAVDYRSGLQKGAIQLIKDTKNAGVLVSRVNLMTMDFGTGQGTRDMGEMTIGSTEVTFKQLKAIYTDFSDKDIYHLIGITPMLGENDDHLKFTTGDAKRVADYAKQHGIGMLSFWNIQRDRSASGNLDDHSNVAESDYEFLHTFQNAR